MMQIFLLSCTKKKKKTFSILHVYFYKRPITIYLFALLYLNNIFLTFFYYPQLPMAPQTLTQTPELSDFFFRVSTYGVRF